jgi:hypothetical protein
MRSDRSARVVCREHGTAETFYYGSCAAGREAAWAGKEERSGEREFRRKIGDSTTAPPDSRSFIETRLSLSERALRLRSEFEMLDQPGR